MKKIILLLIALSTIHATYSMIGQPFTYTPARTPYWYRSQAKSQEQARIKKYWKKRNQEEPRMNQEIQMQREYELNTPAMIQNPEYMPD